MGRKMNRTVKESEEERKVRMNKQHKSVKEKNTGQGKKKSSKKTPKQPKSKTSFLSLCLERGILVQFQVKQYHLDSRITKNSARKSQRKRKSSLGAYIDQ